MTHGPLKIVHMFWRKARQARIGLTKSVKANDACKALLARVKSLTQPSKGAQPKL